MLSRQSASRPRLAAHRRNRGHDRLPPEDGHARGAKAVSPTQPRDRVLPRLDQKQTGTAPIPPARLGQSANGNALGLPHLQPATVDPTAQAASRIRRRLKPQRRDRSREAPYANQTTLPLSHLHSTLAPLWGMGSGFFTASLFEKWPPDRPISFPRDLPLFRHQLPQRPINSRLVASSLPFEPCQNVGIRPQRHCLLDRPVVSQPLRHRSRRTLSPQRKPAADQPCAS